MEYLLGLLAAAVIAFFYEHSQRKSAESLLENSETIKKNNEVDKEISKNEGLDDAESVKREELKKEMESKLNESLSVADIINFFSKRK